MIIFVEEKWRNRKIPSEKAMNNRRILINIVKVQYECKPNLSFSFSLYVIFDKTIKRFEKVASFSCL